MMQEIAARLREELDYALEASHMRLYASIFAGDPLIRVPEVLPELSTQRLLTMTWLEGRRLLDYTDRPLEERNQIARAMFRAWWYPFSHYGVIHGDPHLGNYTVFEDEAGKAAGINLLDYGCMRTFAPKFIQGVVDLYRGLLNNDRALVVHAYETWGFAGLSNELIDILNIWANFIYGPMLEDRVRTIAEEPKPRHVWAARGLQGASGLARQGAGQGAARVRVHGPRGDRPWRGIPAPQCRAELPSPVRRHHRRRRSRRRGARGRRKPSPRPGVPL